MRRLISLNDHCFASGWLYVAWARVSIFVEEDSLASDDDEMNVNIVERNQRDHPESHLSIHQAFGIRYQESNVGMIE